MPEAQEGEDVIPPDNWPLQGLIEVEDLSASYRYIP
jgi:hypothetical protein